MFVRMLAMSYRYMHFLRRCMYKEKSFIRCCATSEGRLLSSVQGKFDGVTLCNEYFMWMQHI